MNKKIKVFIFIFSVIILLLSIFLLNYCTDVYNVRNSSQYDIYYDIDRSLINIKLKASREKESKSLVIGASVTRTLFDDFEDLKISRIIVSAISYKEYYEILQTFLNIHKEVQSVFLPLEYHTLLFDDELFENIGEYDYKNHFSKQEIIRLYFSFDATAESLKYWLQKVNEHINKNDDNQDNESIVIVPKMKLDPDLKLSQSKIDNDFYYFGKIIDFLKEKNVKIYCFIPPVNYIYLQDALSLEKIKVVNNIKKMITSKGVTIYDFTKKNPYNEERLDKSYLFFDVIHPNYLYGNIVYKNLTNQKSDNMWYRIITKDNVDECNKLSIKELEEYKRTHQNYIKEYYTYDYDVDWKDPKMREYISDSKIPDFIKNY